MKNLLPLALALLGALPTHASSFLAVDFTGNTTTDSNGPTVAGWSFQVTTPVLLYGIGFFDYGSDPTLIAPVQVGLWDPFGNLLASGTITGTTDVVVPSTDCCGEWLFLGNGSPIEELLPGTYVIGALAAQTQSEVAAASISSVFPGITFGENLQGSGASGLAEPTITSSPFGTGFFGPNILVGADPNASVPESASFGLVGAGLIVGVVVGRKTPTTGRVA